MWYKVIACCIALLSLSLLSYAQSVSTSATGSAQNAANNAFSPNNAGQATLRLLAQVSRTAALSNPRINALYSPAPSITMASWWAPSVAYSSGDVVVTFSGSGTATIANFFTCTTAGTSASSGNGPSGTGSSISDGSTTWSYTSSQPGNFYNNLAANSYLWNGRAGIGGVVRYWGGYPTSNPNNTFEKTLGVTASTGITAPLQRFEFVTDSVSVLVRFSTVQFGAYYRIIINNQYVSLTPINYQHAAYGFLQIAFSSKAVRDIIIESSNGTLSFGGIDVAATEGVYQPVVGSPLTLIGAGDSYMANGGASLGQNGFFHILCDYLGVQNCVNTGVGGTGYLVSSSDGTAIQRITDVTNQLQVNNNAIVLDENGSNDTAFSQSAIQNAVISYIQAIRAANATVPIIEFGAFPHAAGNCPPCAVIEAAKQGALAQLNDPLVFFVPIYGAVGGSWQTGTGSVSSPNGTGNSDYYISADGVHPSDAGHAFIAGRALQTIQSSVIANSNL